MTHPHRLTLTTASLEIAYEESGPATGVPVVLLHGFPYDVRQYDAVRDKLASSGHRVLVPYLRGFGPTRYRNERIFRSGQQAALGKDVIDFLDGLRIGQAVLVGYDWGGRAACVAAALWPERTLGIVCCSGYTIQDIAKNAYRPASPAEVYRRWYALYFNTDLGPAGLAQNRNEFCKLLWQLWSPTWHFSEAEYQTTALSFDNPDFVVTAIHQYRHRYGNAPDDPNYQELEARLAKQPPIAVPTFVLSGGMDGVEPPPPNDPHRDRFTGIYHRRILPEVGHCVPAEAPEEVVAGVAALLARG
ncbi:Epoxide hydrolase [Acidisarcina polymorpha]|uniref:Epoxide hydrolase n=1 Tax=Acidisarcina polymorpha TaxID=2211140 RepID=A0A2Z5FT22_9BACT|nr:alpha/beta hydrolase [Acidisarcina polymorpha]AXC09989.1 Epoxide hydrolase [Acidisarcina polymorpha]